VKDLEIRLTAVDEASATVAQASKRITDSLREVSDSQRGLAAATQQAIAPLTQEEQVQLETAGTALQLKTAQQDLSSAQNNLNVAIRGYGTNSAEAATALRDLNAAQANVSTLQAQVGVNTKQNTASMRDLTTGISGVATASFSLYGAYDRINESELSLDRSNLMVKSSTKAVEDAQRTLSNAIADHGASSQEARSASDALSIAQDRLTLADERALQAQENVNKSIMSAALQIIPTSITMVDSLSKAWKNFPDVSALLTKISSGVANVGISAKTAAIGVAAFMGGFLIADTLLSAIPEDMRAIAGALTASIAAIVAATIAWMAFHGTMTMGVAVPIILGAVGVGVAGIMAAVAMAEGGVVDRPTYALIGEAGPEIVMPLSQYEASRNADRSTGTETNNSPQEVTVINLTQNIYGDINSEADEDRVAEKAVELLDSRSARRRNM
jgi:hypothetical protein